MRAQAHGFLELFPDHGIKLKRITPLGRSRIVASSPWEESALSTTLNAVNQLIAVNQGSPS
jgi:hypothetical protein